MTATDMIDEIQKACPQFRGVCPNPIFIIGSPRSGTSVLAWALAQHSRLWTSAESDILFYLFGQGHLDKAFQISSSGLDRPWLRNEGVGKPEFASFVGLGLNALFSSRSKGKRWIDQTPLYTVMADQLAEMFPTARFLHILRDGRRVVHSMVHFRDATGKSLETKLIQSGRFPPWATEFREACRAWNRFVNIAMTFAAKNPTRCLTVNHEDLIADPDHFFRRIFDFVDVPPEDGPTTFCRRNRINSSFPNTNAGQFVAESVVKVWDSWSVEQRMTFLGEAGLALCKYGYAAPAELPLEGSALPSNIRRRVNASLPLDCTVAVISKGDSELLNLDGRQGWHFPQTQDNVYAGHHPADSREAIEHLESLRSRGADYLLIPETSFWWLDFYAEFRDHLEGRYRCIWSDANCRVFMLRESLECPSQAVACAVHNSRCDDPPTPEG